MSVGRFVGMRGFAAEQEIYISLLGQVQRVVALRELFDGQETWGRHVQWGSVEARRGNKTIDKATL